MKHRMKQEDPNRSRGILIHPSVTIDVHKRRMWTIPRAIIRAKSRAASTGRLLKFRRVRNSHSSTLTLNTYCELRHICRGRYFNGKPVMA